MTKEQFREKRFSPENQAFLEKINDVIEDYQAQGYKLTLRQLYYQLVSSDIIPNRTQEYSHLSRVLTDARMAGLVDWEAIEDRIRVPKKHSEFDNLNDLIKAALYSYRRDRWEGQENYIEVWVEKDALSGVLEPITDKWHCTLMVNRGYSSASAMYDAAQRFLNQESDGKTCSIAYLGDLDPSGEDMVRDIDDRLNEFGCSVEVNKIALNMDQVQKYKPPPNPAKMSDSRAPKFVAEFGRYSWEVDALNPKILNGLVTDAITDKLDMDKYEAIVDLENEEKEKLEKFGKRFDD